MIDGLINWLIVQGITKDDFQTMVSSRENKIGTKGEPIFFFATELLGFQFEFLSMLFFCNRALYAKHLYI